MRYIKANRLSACNMIIYLIFNPQHNFAKKSLFFIFVVWNFTFSFIFYIFKVKIHICQLYRGLKAFFEVFLKFFCKNIISVEILHLNGNTQRCVVIGDIKTGHIAVYSKIQVYTKYLPKD